MGCEYSSVHKQSVKRTALGYHNLSLSRQGRAFKPGAMIKDAMMACFRFDTNMAPLFPYINAEADRAELFNDPDLIRFGFERWTCVFYPEYGLATPFAGKSEARRFIERLFVFLNDINSRRDEIVPSHRVFQRISALEILKLLPRTNCRECGFSSCMAFAANLGQRQTNPELCPYIGSPMDEQLIYPVYDSNGNLESTVKINVHMPRMRQNSLESDGNRTEDIAGGRKKGEFSGESFMAAALTDREIEVLRSIAQGATNIEISHILKISPHTVKSHVINIFNKLGVNDRTQAAVMAIRHNLI